MPRVLSPTIPRLFALGLLALLTACAQQREPGFYDVPREGTTSDARHRAQGDANTVAPSQVQLGFGNTGTQTASSQDAMATPSAGTGAATGTSGIAQLPDELRETRTYLGTVACPVTGQAACPPRRMTLTMAPDGQWRNRSTPLDGSAASTALGCWHLVSTEPARIVLQTGDQAIVTLEFIQSNVLRVTRVNGKKPLLESRLTRQADIDPISELAAKPAETCAEH